MAHPSTADRLRSAATARSTVFVLAALLSVVALARATPLPEELAFVAWPAFAAALLLGTALFNELGVAVGDAGFWALFVGWAYVEAALLVVLVRAARRARDARRRTEPA
ncbi:hypothetical protein [Halobaculum lipolyticum]|uniref:Uncharacterized protein n=1 Tax=Halobaculum lipolyticum TaxID=3032001 RepID=A0ABD5WED0_9EURY|nr:hypothetical protein [Halobaculum sp. DT31]